MLFSQIKLVFSLALRNVFRNYRRSLLTLFAIMIGVWSSVALASLARGIAEQMAKDAIASFTGHVQIHAPSYPEDPVLEHRFSEKIFEKLESLKLKEAEVMVARLRVPAVIRSEREVAGVTLIGTQPGSEAVISFVAKNIVEGKFIESEKDRGLILGQKLVELLQTRIGKRVVLMSEDSAHQISDRGFRILGTYHAEIEATEKGFVLTGLKTAQEFLKSRDDISEISLLLKNRQDADKVKKQLEKHFPDLRVSTWIDRQPLIEALMRLQSGFLLLWYFVVIITVAFGLVNTLFMSIFERVREIGVVCALGMKRNLVMFQILFESLILLICGSLLGDLLAALTIKLLENGIDISSYASAAAQHIGIRSVIVPHLNLFDWLAVNIMILVLGLLGSLYPGYKASRLEPIEAIWGRH